MGADTAVDVVQGNGNTDTANTASAHTACVVCRQFVRGIYRYLCCLKIAA